MIKVVIFDADHTLYDIDTSHAYEDMFRYLAKVLRGEKSVIERTWREHVRNILNSRDAKNPEKRKRRYSLYILLGQFNITDDKTMEEIMEHALEIFWSGVLETLEPKKNMRDVLKELKNDSVLCVASDEFKDVLKPKLEKALPEWKDIFALVVTPEDTGTMKPSRKYYSTIIKRLGVDAKSCVVVGDSWERDLKPAKELGIKTVLIGKQKHGNPDAVIETLDELMDVIKSF
jgi:putative hydrolase of the HAD superfamily